MLGKKEQQLRTQIQQLERQAAHNILFICAFVLEQGGEITLSETAINNAAGAEMLMEMDSAMRTITLKARRAETPLTIRDPDLDDTTTEPARGDE